MENIREFFGTQLRRGFEELFGRKPDIIFCIQQICTEGGIRHKDTTAEVIV
mgnify:CR=1 FL=1